jgi:PIN domain nuclease of toxin-antitoxin system
LSPRARAEVDQSDQIAISTVSCFELATLVRRGRLELDRPVREWIGYASGMRRVQMIPPSTEVAEAAGSIESAFPGDPADRLIYATAQALDARLVTKDRRIRAYDRERVVW